MDEREKRKSYKILESSEKSLAENQGEKGRFMCMCSDPSLANTKVLESIIYTLFIFTNFTKMTSYLFSAVV